MRFARMEKTHRARKTYEGSARAKEAEMYVEDHVGDKQAMRDGWRNFINDLGAHYHLEWMAHFTLKDDVTPETARKKLNNFLGFLRLRCLTMDEIKRGENILAIVVEERTGRDLDCPHYHALLGNGVRRLDPEEWQQRARAELGLSLIKEYDPARGGLHYLVKSVGSGAVIEIPFAPRPGSPPLQ